MESISIYYKVDELISEDINDHIKDKIRDLKPAHDLGILKKYLISSSIYNEYSIVTRNFNSLIIDCAKFISN